jgi:PPK2 family polyphosphate:nucleotide phosphotransferase
MKIKTKDFFVGEKNKVNLKKWPTKIEPIYKSKEKYREILADHIQRMSDYQNLHYALNESALLLVFQGMDASGKDGTIAHVMSGVNPQGCQVFSFKHPTDTELKHDFLWRTSIDLPERGKIGIFNRSYYEELLISRVHPELLKAEGFPSGLDTKKFWQKRFDSINQHEAHLERNGTHIVKFFLHLSFAEQTKRFLERIDTPEKNWKLTLDDIKERGYWKEYQQAYEKCLGETSTKHAPWYVIPADDKWNARLIVSQIILNTFENMNMKYPKADPKRLKELAEIRKQLENPYTVKR